MDADTWFEDADRPFTPEQLEEIEKIKLPDDKETQQGDETK